MPGAGKSTAAEAIATLGFAIVNMGDVIRKETQKRGLPLTEESIGSVMLELRQRKGPGAVAELCFSKIESSGSSLVVIDGARSVDEVEVFRRLSDVKVLAVHASPRKRYDYLMRRGRTDAPLTWQSLVARDDRELRVGLGKIIALSDEVISNNDVTIRELRSRAKNTAKKWMKRLAS